ncbi:MAG: hypothetical protein IJR96_04445 [Pseudobutyrivibrio sp.]|nr:hypothetical protein [Pseudobutyrivibrio sp.]
MITVRTRRKIGMTQQQYNGTKEANFILGLGRNFLDFIDKYSLTDKCENSFLYGKMSKAVDDKDYEEIERIFSTVQVFGTYDDVTMLTTKYKSVKSAVGNALNGTVYEGRADEQSEIERIVNHTCGLCSPQGNEMLEKMLA